MNTKAKPVLAALLLSQLLSLTPFQSLFAEEPYTTPDIAPSLYLPVVHGDIAAGMGPARSLNSLPLADGGRIVTLLGPLTLERSRGKPLTTAHQVTVPSSVGGPFMLRIQNGPDGSPRVSSARLTLNGVELLGPSNFNQKVEWIEQPLELQPGSAFTLEIHMAGKPGGRLRLSLTGVDTTPEEIVLHEEQAVVGAGGGLVNLPDVGEIQVGEAVVPSGAQFTLRQIQAFAAVERFAAQLPSPYALLLETIFEVETTAQMTGPTAVRINLPPAVIATLPPDQRIDLFAEVLGDEGIEYEALAAVLNPLTQQATALLPAFVWQPRETQPAGLVASASTATTSYVVRILAATNSTAADALADGRFADVGQVFFVQGNEQLQLHAEVHMNSTVLLIPTTGSPVVTTGYGAPRPSAPHRAVDIYVPAGTPIIAVRDGQVSFASGAAYVPGSPNPCATGTPRDGLSGLGYYATMNHGNGWSTKYGHLTPQSNTVASGASVPVGAQIANSGHSGCTAGPTGDHLHFELYSSLNKRANPCPFFMPPLASCEAQAPSYSLRLALDGSPVPGQVSFDPALADYTLPLDLTQMNVQSNRTYMLSLILIERIGGHEVARTLDSVELKVNQVPMRVTLTWDKADTDVDLHVRDSSGRESWFANLCGLGPGNCLDRDDVDGFGPEVFTLQSAEAAMAYEVFLHYWSDHGNGPTTARVLVEVNGSLVADRFVSLINDQTVSIGAFSPTP